MKRLLRVLKEWRLLLMLFLLISSLLIIRPRLNTSGVLVNSVSSPAVNHLPTGVIIKSINGYEVSNLTTYHEAVNRIEPGDEVLITYEEDEVFYQTSTSTTYPFLAGEEGNETVLGISVSVVPWSNLEFGLDLSGGTKVLLEPNETVPENELQNIVGILEQRLNVYGFKEIPINTLSDLSGNQYIKVELPSSVSVESIQELLEKQGMFEAKVGNETVFTGEDILSVCVTGADCVLRGQQVQNGYLYEFGLTISQTGAERFANVTKELAEVNLENDCYLNESIVFFLDGESLQSEGLKISCNLKGVPEDNPVIRVGGANMEEAKNNMKSLRSMLQSSNLPVKLLIESVEIISPKLGQEFLSNTSFVFLLSILCVDLIIALRYKSLKIALPIIFITLSEIIITLGVATWLNWTFDLAAIAGLIASVGTGVDDQIIITDEVLTGEKDKLRFKRRVKRAFMVVFATFFTSVAVMIPLTMAGAGILKGFATTTIIAISVGVLITRPAYARLLELVKKS